jgi:hypothetical protein
VPWASACRCREVHGYNTLSEGPRSRPDLGHMVGELTHQPHRLPLTYTLRYTDIGFVLARVPPISQFSPLSGCL